MEMLQRRREQYPAESWDGATISDATWSDETRRGTRVEWPAFINWRTAQALQRRGLLTYEYIGPEEGATLTLTSAGVAWPATVEAAS
jgi:hypothetical protein